MIPTGNLWDTNRVLRSMRQTLLRGMVNQTSTLLLRSSSSLRRSIGTQLRRRRRSRSVPLPRPCWGLRCRTVVERRTCALLTRLERLRHRRQTIVSGRVTRSGPRLEQQFSVTAPRQYREADDQACSPSCPAILPHLQQTRSEDRHHPPRNRHIIPPGNPSRSVILNGRTMVRECQH